MLDPELPTTSEPALSPWDGHRRVLASAAIWGSVTLLAKFVAFGKDWLVARRFGAGDELDAFLVALLIPTYAVAVLSNSFASGFLPTYLRLWQREGKAAAGRLISSALAAAIMLLVAVILLLSVLSLWLLPLLGEGFDSAKLALAQSLFYVLAGMVAITGVSAVLAAVLNAHERFTITAWAPLAVPLGTIAVFGPFEGPDAIEALAWGTLLGYALEAAVLATGAYRRGLLPVPRWHGLDGDLRHVASQYLPITLGAVLMSSSILIDQSMAASLGGGNVSVLNFGNKIPALLLSIVAISLSTVLFPRFARLIMARQWNELERTIRLYATVILLGSVPLLLILAYFSEPLVGLLFQRGAFTAETTHAVALVQICYLPQVPFAILVTLGYRLLSALDSNRALLAIGVLNLLINVTGNLALMHWLGVRGIALSTSLMLVVAALATYTTIRYKLAQARARAGDQAATA
jgi:putative peptidoglycan lipid II flippase